MDDEYDDEEIINNLASHEEHKTEIRFDKKQKTESLRKIFSIFPEDRRGLLALHKEFLKLQRRFRHMFKPGNEWMIEDLQKEIDKKWAYLEMMEKITNEN